MDVCGSQAHQREGSHGPKRLHLVACLPRHGEQLISRRKHWPLRLATIPSTSAFWKEASAVHLSPL